jgi:putative redox protein
MSVFLKKIIAETSDRLRADPAAGQASFHASSAQQRGLRSVALLRQHEVTVDEPAELGGTDRGPNPVELVLAALGTCQEITYRAYATALGIPLDSVSVKLRGDLDLRGFFAVDPAVRPGYQRIQGTVSLRSDRATPEQLQQLREVVNQHCPVLDILRNPVPVQLDVALDTPLQGVSASPFDHGRTAAA